MKNLIKTSLVAIALLIGVNASAQDKAMQFGVKAGVNLSNFGGNIKDSKAVIGFNAGVTLDYEFANDLYLMTGLEFTIKGAKYESSTKELGVDVGSKVTYDPMYLELPVHLGYKLAVMENTKIVFHAGPYVAYGIGGKITTKGNIENVTDTKKSNFFSKEAFKNFDYGIGGGVGAEFGMIAVNVGYDFGLGNITRTDNWKVKTENAYLTVGYKF